MSARYAPLPTHRTDLDSDGELEAAFDDSDDDDDGDVSESHPLNASRATRESSPPPAPIPGAYDFERVDYDVPPPGSPTRAMTNDFGNTNGLIPSFNTDVEASQRSPSGNGWLRRTATAVLPSHYIDRFGLSPHHYQSVRLAGGGSSNDGVFANMMAKPDRLIRVQDGDDNIYLAPEETQKDAPPSYSSAQADAVPPYWETTIHLSTSANPTAGEMIVEGLPTGSLFSFAWNMLVSVSFQFVGFLLTFLLHTTHSAKLGSRAGLGVTLIQYGFALRSKADSYNGDAANDSWGSWKGSQPADPAPSSAQIDDYFNNLNVTNSVPDMTDGLSSADTTTEWLSFLLMTIGWFILLTSMLSFWRVKRWERSILNSSARDSNSPQTPVREAALLARLEQAFGLRGLSDGTIFRQGLGFRNERNSEPIRTEQELTVLHPDPDVRLAAAYAQEARLHDDLRSAGFL